MRLSGTVISLRVINKRVPLIFILERNSSTWELQLGRWDREAFFVVVGNDQLLAGGRALRC